MNDETAAADIVDIIEEGISSFEGFSRFPDAGFTDNIQSMLSSQKGNPGIKVSEEDGQLTVNCEIIVYFGVNIPQLCYDIQSKVKHEIEGRTGIPVKAVNIRVEGIDRANGPV